MMDKLLIHGFTHINTRLTSILQDDFTELWLIVSIIYKENPQLSLDELKQATLDILSYQYETSNLVLVDENTEKPVSKTKVELLEMVKVKFEVLNRMPNIGDGIWLFIEDSKP